jgi:hypothetical protein
MITTFIDFFNQAIDWKSFLFREYKDIRSMVNIRIAVWADKTILRSVVDSFSIGTILFIPRLLSSPTKQMAAAGQQNAFLLRQMTSERNG